MHYAQTPELDEILYNDLARYGTLIPIHFHYYYLHHLVKAWASPSLDILSTIHSFASLAVSKRSFISVFGQSGLADGCGRDLSQAHLSANTGDSDPSSIWRMYLPSTGKNLNP